MSMNLFDFKIISKFKDNYFRKLILKQHLVQRELFIQDMKTPEDKDGYPERTFNTFFYELNKGGVHYLLRSKDVKELPLFVTEFERVGYKGNGYRLINKFKSARFVPEKHYSFKELVNTVAPFNHTSPNDWIIYKLLVFASLLDRINFRCSSEPAFGKDSFISIMEDFTGDIAVIQNPTIAKLEFLSLNKLLMVNEVVNLEPKEIRDIEQYLLSTGAFDNKYTKRSRGSRKHGSQEEYDISKLSLVIAYNNKECYREGTKYFDHMFQKAVLDRFPAFKLSGTLNEQFPDVGDAETIAKNNETFFVNIIRTFEWFKQNWRQDLHNYKKPEYDLPLRHSRVFDVLLSIVDLYSESQNEFDEICELIFKRYKGYKNMITPQQTWEDSFVSVTHVK